MNGDRSADALIWLSFAVGDLEAARSHGGRRAAPPRIVAFHGEQAAEKAIKAALVLSGVDPPRTHDLNDLRNRLPDGWGVKRSPRDLGRLSTFATASRYPDNVAPVRPVDAATAVRQAMVVVRLVREDFARRGLPVAALEPL